MHYCEILNIYHPLSLKECFSIAFVQLYCSINNYFKLYKNHKTKSSPQFK